MNNSIHNPDAPRTPRRVLTLKALALGLPLGIFLSACGIFQNGDCDCPNNFGEASPDIKIEAPVDVAEALSSLKDPLEVSLLDEPDGSAL